MEDLPRSSVNDHPIITPLAIIDSRIILKYSKLERQVFIHWKQLPKEESSWESFEELIKDYRNLHLEDKVIFNGKMDDRMLECFPMTIELEKNRGATEKKGEDIYEVIEAAGEQDGSRDLEEMSRRGASDYTRPLVGYMTTIINTAGY